jgi:hypothetical protein
LKIICQNHPISPELKAIYFKSLHPTVSFINIHKSSAFFAKLKPSDFHKKKLEEKKDSFLNKFQFAFC